LQPLGFEKGETPHNQVEDMAAYYISEIRRIQPHGPYYLAGHCYGCTIVFEMAQQLYAHGSSVALLALIDQSSPLRAAVPAPLLTRINAYTRRILYEYNAKNLTWAFLMESFYRRFSLIRRVQEVKQEIDPHEQRIKQVMDAHFSAVMSYIPQPYPGKITLLQNSKSYEMEQAGVLTRRWSDLAQGGFDRRVIEGTHWNIFAEEPRFRQLAEELRNCLEGAQSSHETTL
jgi:thioesterase domain-containing protein